MNRSEINERLHALAVERANDSGSAFFTTGELRDLMSDPTIGERPSNRVIRQWVWRAIQTGHVGTGSHNRRLNLPA